MPNKQTKHIRADKTNKIANSQITEKVAIIYHHKQHMIMKATL